MKSGAIIKMNNDRAIILGLIKEKRDILFGRYSETLTHQLKMETWAGIHRKGCSMGILDPSKGWRYFRDTVWQNWKKRSLKRANSKKQNRTISSSRRYKLDELDKTVLEIVGTRTDASQQEDTRCRRPRLDKIDEPLQELIRSDTPVKAEQVVSVTEPSETESHHTYETDSHHTCETASSFTMPVIPQQESKPLTKEEIELKILRAKLGLLEREAYIQDIEIYKKEKEAGLPMSAFTKKFYNDYLNASGELESRWYSESVASQCKVETN